MGANEHGLVIGNTALFTRMEYETDPGLEVRCLYDASGGAMSKQYLQDLTKAGVEILPYLEYRNLTRLHTANYRSHRKIAAIDGKIGYVDGLNLDKEQMDSPAFDTWRDTHLRIVGEGAWALQASFVISWFNTTGQKVIGQQYYPPVETENFMPVQITQGGPDSQWKAIRQLYFQMITSAEDKLYIQSPFFIPDESILAALKAAALAGVDVQLMFTPRGSTYQIPYRAAHTYFKDVVEAGAKVYLYFFEDLKHCQRWTLEEYNSYSPVHRFVDSVYRLASPLL